MQSEVARLYEKLKSVDYRHFYDVGSEFYLYFFCNASREIIPFVNAYLMVAGWFGISSGSGVWIFYETARQADLSKAIDYLKQTGDQELAAVMEMGLHDYQNTVSTEINYFPDAWMAESEKIDAWIRIHAEWLEQWLYNALMKHEELILSL